MLWSFWITSLVIGYVSIIRNTAVPLFLLTKYRQTSEDKKFWKLPAAKKLFAILFVLLFAAQGLFTIIFMSFHFLIFHLFIAFFLQMSFPHPDVTNILANPNIGEFNISIKIICALLLSYWIIVVEKLIFDYLTYREKSINNVSEDQKSPVGELFSLEGIKRPYIQVARMHISICLLLGLNAINTNQYLVYVLIYCLFFFPMPYFGKGKS